MAIYEILIRGATDGSIVGAQMQHYDASGRPGDVQSLDPAAIASTLGAEFTTLAAQIVALQTEVAQLQAAQS